MMKRIHPFVSIAAAAALVGCGGGTSEEKPYIDIGYSGPTTTVTITSSAAVGEVVTAADSGVLAFSSAGDTSAVGVGGAAPTATVKAALATLARHRIGADGAVVVGATQSQTVGCAVSGSMTASATIADPSGQALSPGDSISVSFDACNDGYGVVMAGSMSIRIDACPAGSYCLDSSAIAPGDTYAMTATINDFVTEDLTTGAYSGIDGGESMSMTYTADLDGVGGWLDSSVTGSRLSFEEGVDKVATSSAKIEGIGGGSYSLESGEHYATDPSGWPDTYSSAISARLCSSEMAGCVNVATTSPFMQNDLDPYPYTGTIRYSDDAGHYVEVTATDGTTGAIVIYYDIGAGRVGPITCSSASSASTCVP